MNTYTKKYFWMLLLIFCFLFLSESVDSKGAAVEKREEHKTEKEYENLATEEKSGRYITIYINETSSIQIDLILIIECLALLLIIVLEKVR